MLHSIMYQLKIIDNQGHKLFEAIENNDEALVESILNNTFLKPNFREIKSADPKSRNSDPLKLALGSYSIFERLLTVYYKSISFLRIREVLIEAVFLDKKEIVALLGKQYIHTKPFHAFMNKWMLKFAKEASVEMLKILMSFATDYREWIKPLYVLTRTTRKDASELVENYIVENVSRDKSFYDRFQSEVRLRHDLLSAMKGPQSINLEEDKHVKPLAIIKESADKYGDFLIDRVFIEAIQVPNRSNINKLFELISTESTIQNILIEMQTTNISIHESNRVSLVDILKKMPKPVLKQSIIDQAYFEKNHIDLPRYDHETVSIITAAPHGTLGDVSAAYKLIQHLIACKPEIEINWIVVNIESPNLKLDNFTNKIISSNFKSLEIQGAASLLSVKDILIESDLIVSVPTHHYFVSESHFLYGLNRPVISITEYDFNEYHDLKNRLLTRVEINEAITLQSGLNDQALGIYLPQHQAEKDEMINRLDDILADVNHADNKAVAKLTEGYKNFREYTEKQSFFFGYFNTDKNVSVRNASTPMEFILAAILKEYYSNNSVKQIDFVVRYELREGDLSDFIRINLNPILRSKNLDVSIDYFWIKNNLTISYGSKESSRLHLRIINPFGLSSESFEALKVTSDLFCALTGDQSFSEGLNKIFLYQIMSWKLRLYTSFLTILSDQLGADAMLTKFYRIQSLSTVFHYEFEKLLIESQRKGQSINDLFIEMRAQARQIEEYIKFNKNLSNELPDTILKLIADPICVIKKLKDKIIDTEQDLNLIGLYYPRHIQSFTSIVSNEPKYETFLNHYQKKQFLPEIKKELHSNRMKRQRSNNDELDQMNPMKKFGLD